MPIEIRELHIRVAVSAPPEAASTPAAPAAPAAPGAGGAAPQNEALVAECVEQVLRILQHKTER
jgi:3-oxoacyl-ACP reductase-like protein